MNKLRLICTIFIGLMSLYSSILTTRYFVAPKIWPLVSKAKETEKIEAGRKAFTVRDEQYAYRPNLASLAMLENETYKTLAGNTQHSFKYVLSLLNDRSFYDNIPAVQPGVSTPETEGALAEGPVLVQFVKKLHSSAKEAVILIHGNSVIPDDWFSDEYYLNNGGEKLHSAGFDIYCPYVTHSSRFQNSRSRLAALVNQDWKSLDVLRIKLLFNSIKEKYNKIHIVGISGGGMIASLFAKANLQEQNMGCVLNIEGWSSSKNIAEVDDWTLFAWNYEMVFHPPSNLSYNDFLSLPENCFLAVGHYSLADAEITFMKQALTYDKENLILYAGGHEFILAVWEEALNRFLTRQDSKKKQ